MSNPSPIDFIYLSEPDMIAAGVCDMPACVDTMEEMFALLHTGDRTWARKHFEKSLAGYEALGADYLPDLDAVASNYTNFLREEGEENLAEVIAGRVREVIGEPAED